MEPQPVQETPAQLTKYQQEEIAVSSNLVNAILSPNHLIFSRNVEVLAEKLRSVINEIVPGDLDSYDRLVAARLDVYERIHLELTAAETRVAYYKKYAPEEYGLAFDNARETLKESGVLDVTQESLIVDYVEKVNAVREASSRLDANYDDVDPRSRIFGPQVIKELDKLEAVTDEIADYISGIENKTEFKTAVKKLTKLGATISQKEVDNLLKDKDMDSSDYIDFLNLELEVFKENKIAEITGESRAKILSDMSLEDATMYRMAKDSPEFVAEFLASYDKAGYMASRYVETARRVSSDFDAWYTKTEQALKDRGIQKPDPITQYELLKLPDDVPLVRNEIECK